MQRFVEPLFTCGSTIRPTPVKDPRQQIGESHNLNAGRVGYAICIRMPTSIAKSTGVLAKKAGKREALPQYGVGMKVLPFSVA